jgi:hypothetical protein
MDIEIFALDDCSTIEGHGIISRTPAVASCLGDGVASVQHQFFVLADIDEGL